MAGDRNVTIRLRGDIGDFNAKMMAATRSVGSVVGKMTDAEKESAKFRQGLTSVGDAAGKVGLAAAAGVTAAVAVAANFDQAMSKVRAATHESADNMDALREAAIKAGADTAFSASEAAEGIENLAKAGVETGEILGGGLQGALDLAAAGTMDVADAAEAAAGAMAQFGLDGEEVPHIADLLAAAAGKAQGEVSDMVMALKQSGTVAAQTGLSIEETTGALAAMAEQSLLGSDAGTSFKTMLMRLLPQTKEAGDAMEAIGFSAFDASGELKSLVEIAGGLETGLRDMTTEQRQATLATIFGQDAIRAATILYDQGADGIENWIRQVDDQGFAAETAGIKLDNLAGDLEAFKGSLETALIGSGDGAQGALRPLVRNATDAVNVFNDLPPAMQGTVTQMLAITAITGGGLWFGSRVIQGVASTREAMEMLGGSSSKASKAMRGVAAAGAGLAVLSVGVAAVKSIQEATDEALPGLERLTADLLRVKDAGLTAEYESIGDSIKRIMDPSFTQGWNDWMMTPATKVLGWESGSLREAKAEIESLDAAFANIATQGGVDKAMAAFRDFAAAADLTVSEQRDLLDQMPQLDDAMASASTSAELMADETDGAADGLDELGDSAKGAEKAILSVEEALGMLEVKLERRGEKREVEQAFDDLRDRLKERADLLKELAEARAASPDGDAAVDARRDIAEAQRDLGSAKTDSAKKAAREKLANATERLRDAEQSMGEEAARNAERVAELEEQVKDFALTLDDREQAGRDWNEMFEDMAFKTLEAAEQMKGMGRVNFINRKRDEFIELAALILGSKKEARELADELLLLHQRPVKPKVDLDISAAQEKLRELRRDMAATFDTKGGRRLQPGITESEGGDGSFASGGFTGVGGKYEPAGIVHRGEFVFDAQTTAMFRPFFEELHRTRRMPGYADGGFVRQISAPTVNTYHQAPSIDYDRLASAMSQVRPLYGDVNVADGRDFLRTLEQDRHRAALEGRR